MAVRRSHLMATAFTVLIACCSGNNAANAEDDLVGRWRVQYFARMMKPVDDVPEEEAIPSRLGDEIEIEIQRNKLFLSRGKVKFEFALEVVSRDVTAGEITLTYTDKNRREHEFPGIYRIKDGQLLLCLSLYEKRPTDFELKCNELKVLMRLKRK